MRTMVRVALVLGLAVSATMVGVGTAQAKPCPVRAGVISCT